MRTYAIGVDVGGTCTDCTVMSDEGRVTVAKAYSTPSRLADGILDALAVAAGELGLSRTELLTQTSLFLHGTTVGENALADGQLASVGLITTDGFGDTLFATRGGFGRWSGLSEMEKRNPVATFKPPSLVPRSRITTVEERVDRTGAICKPLSPREAERAAEKMVSMEVDAVAICLLWSFANPAHELMLREAIERISPQLSVTLSHELAPVVGEYERTSTVALNATLAPTVSSYLGTLADQLAMEGLRSGVLVMQANGGLVSASRAVQRPVAMIECGPVSGVLASQRLGELLGVENIISADMGGTTFKVGAVRGGRVEYQHEAQVFRYHYALPKLDIVSLGIAGGSIVRFDERTGTPEIGPESAGSYPGPIVYGHGGVAPTVTDIDAILGFMDPRYFLGGRERFEIEPAREAFESSVASKLQLPLLQAAGAIYRLANAHLFDLLHRTTVQRGLDPRRFILFSTGGTAGMHLPALADELHVRGVVIPYSASVHGAFGLLTSDVVHEELAMHPVREPFEISELDQVLGGLEEKVRAQFEADGFALSDVSISCAIDMRYRRQVHEITVPLADGRHITEAALARLIEDFTDLYRERYGAESTWTGAAIELVTFRVRGAAGLPQPKLRSQTLAGTYQAIPVEERPVFLPLENREVAVFGYELDRLAVGSEVRGPALIWSPITSVVVNSHQAARVDEYRNLIIESQRSEP